MTTPIQSSDQNWDRPGDVGRGNIVPVYVELEGTHRAMVRYTIESLMMPLGLTPAWVESPLASEHTVVYYGPADAVGDAPVQLAYDPKAAAVLEGLTPYDASGMSSISWEGERWPVLFKDSQGSPDLIASAFYLLAGIQELTTRERDQNGRFRFEGSLHDRFGFAGMPVVDAYREMLASMLTESGVVLSRRSWGDHTWAVCPTFDVDYLWKWRKGMIYREVVRYFLMNDLQRPARDRAVRLGHFVRDVAVPGDRYREALERMVEEVRARGGTATVFLKAGAHGPQDVAYSLRGRWLAKIVRSATDAGFEIGLHPSYYAETHGGYLSDEVDKLDGAFGVRPTSVRQHYLRYDPYITPDLHRTNGFLIDSTLGFATREGFRRSTCVPFRLFDLRERRPVDIWEMPLVVMDGSLFNRRGMTANEAFDVTRQLLDRCRSFGGCAVLLWHNVLWDELDAPHWGRHFVEILDYAAEQGALIADLDSTLRNWRRSAL